MKLNHESRIYVNLIRVLYLLVQGCMRCACFRNAVFCSVLACLLAYLLTYSLTHSLTYLLTYTDVWREIHHDCEMCNMNQVQYVRINEPYGPDV